MEMMDRVSEDIQTAMKAKDKTRLNVLRFVKKLLIENKTAKQVIPELDVVIKYAKQLNDSLTQFPVESEQYKETQAELVVLKEYLPGPMSETEVQKIIDEIKQANPSANMGLIMKELGPHIKGRFDGKKASDMVKASL